MPSSRISHPLKRYAKVTPDQQIICRRYAPAIAEADRLPLLESIGSLIALTNKAGESCSHEYRRSYEAGIIMQMSWFFALEQGLQQVRHPCSTAAASQLISVGFLLNYIPVKLLRIRPPMRTTLQELGHLVSLEHLRKISSILLWHDHAVPRKDLIRTCDVNTKVVHFLLSEAVRKEWRPKRLENEAQSFVEEARLERVKKMTRRIAEPS